MTGVQLLPGAGFFLFAATFRAALGFTQPPLHWVPGALSLGGKIARAWSRPLTSITTFMVWYLHTGTSLPLPLHLPSVLHALPISSSLIIQITILGEDYKLQDSSLWNLLKPLVTSLLDPVPCPQTPSICIVTSGLKVSKYLVSSVGWKRTVLRSVMPKTMATVESNSPLNKHVKTVWNPIKQNRSNVVCII